MLLAKLQYPDLPFEIAWAFWRRKHVEPYLKWLEPWTDWAATPFHWVGDRFDDLAAGRGLRWQTKEAEGVRRINVCGGGRRRSDAVESDMDSDEDEEEEEDEEEKEGRDYEAVEEKREVSFKDGLEYEAVSEKL
jgi:hypothetical protein